MPDSVTARPSYGPGRNGRKVRNQQDAASDIDVLLIGNPKGDALAEAMQKLERQLGREINYTVLTRRECDSRRARKDAFLENVWHNKRVSLVAAHEKTQAAKGDGYAVYEVKDCRPQSRR